MQLATMSTTPIKSALKPSKPTSPPPLKLDIDSIFVGKDFRSESYSQLRWWDSGCCYTALLRGGSRGRVSSSGKEKNGKSSAGSGGGSGERESSEKPSAPQRDLVWHDLSTSTSETYVSSDLLIPPGYDAPLTVDDYALSPDKSRLLIFTNSQKVWRKKSRGDYWVLVRWIFYG